LDNKLIRKLLTSVETLQSDVATLKSRATSGPSSQLIWGTATLPETSSIVSGKDPPTKWARSEEREDSKKEPMSSDEEDDNVFTLSEAGSAFMEMAFKSKMSTASRKKKMAKLGLPDTKWTKSLELDAFITSTIPK